MKIIQVPYCFHPGPVGGTEVYVEALARQLKDRGIEVLVAAPGGRNEAYVHKGLSVRRFAVSHSVSDLRELYDEGNENAAESFRQILEEEEPDLVHLHAFTRGVSLRLVREAKSKNLPVIFTYHTPTVSCQRGTLMRWGREVCDGVLRLHDCSRCTLHGLGVGKSGSYFLGTLPMLVGRVVGACGLAGGIWTGLRMTELVRLRHESFRALTAEVDHVVATAEWVKDLLIRNHVPLEKITVSPQGIDSNGFDSSTPRSNNRDSQSELKAAFVGRMHPTKGLDVLVRAIRSVPSLPLTLDIYGIIQGEEDRRYEEKIRSLADGDRRIHFLDAVSNHKIISLLRNVDILAVPSQCVETGPRVVLEAFAAGIPIIGSNLGGIRELVKHGVNGLLVEPRSSEEWTQSLRKLCEEKSLMARLQAGVPTPRTLSSVSEEMLALYTRFIPQNAIV